MSHRWCVTLFALAAVASVCGATASAQQSVTIAPSNITLIIGQTRQFTATATLVPSEAAAGGEYTCVLLTDGSEHCTGRNQFGQLGDGQWNNVAVPVPASLSSVAHLAGGDEFSCAVIADGTMKCWGLGEKGQRGDGTFDMLQNAPVAVVGVTTAVAAGAGYNHACARLADGTVQCWGSNAYGQLGDPSTATESSTPVSVGGMGAPLSIAVGAFHTCAVLADHTAQCWGRNDSGQVGDGTMNNAVSPVAVGGLSSVASIAGGGSHTCAALTDGTVQCWGDNYLGQLGNGTSVPSPTPVPVSGLTNAVAITAGWAHSCALLLDGSVVCWGEGVNGELGNGAAQNSSTPVTVAGISGATAVTAGWWHHSCAVVANGISCWGTNDWGQLGDGTTTSASAPVAMSAVGITWSSDTPAVATIGATGLATAVQAGVATISATDSSGAFATTTITVVKPRFVLTVSRSGATQSLGTVTSGPGAINCGSACSDIYDSDTVVTLTASPAPLVAGWTGCDAVNGATCTVTVQSARSVVARFLDTPPLQ